MQSRRQLLRHSTAALAAGIAPRIAGAVTSGDPALDGLRRLADRLSEADRFSGVVLVRRDRQPLLARAYGLADRSSGVPVGLDTRFALASVGKLFTVTAIWQLIAQQRLTLESSVGSVLTDYPNREVATMVTVRHLLTHQGGTGDIDIFAPEHAANRAAVRELADFLPLHGARAPAFTPGSRSEYSNYGFILLGLMIERLSGRTYRDHVARAVFAPAGMVQAGFPVQDETAIDLAVGYTRFWPEADRAGALISNRASLPYRGSSAGGGVASARDLTRFIDAMEDGRLIPQALLRQVIPDHPDAERLGIPAGGKGDGLWWGHGGGAPGMSVDVRRYPARGEDVVVLANRDPDIANQLAGHFAYLRLDPAGDAVIYLRGTMNDWQPFHALARRDPETWMADITLPAGDHQFKLASEDWATVDLGASDDRPLQVGGAGVPLSHGGGNLSLMLDRPAEVRIVMRGLRTGQPELRIQPR